MNPTLKFFIIGGMIVMFTWPLAVIHAISLYDLNSNQIVVNTLEDELNSDGDCSLREAITAANANHAVDGCQSGQNSTVDNIHFSRTGTITLTSSLPQISTPQVIDGGNAIALSGGHQIRHFYVAEGGSLALQNLTLVNGNAPNDYGGAIFSNGVLTLTNCLVSNNAAAMAGALYVKSSTTHILNSVIADNVALYSAGALFIEERANAVISDSDFVRNKGSSYYGGAILNGGTAIIQRSTIANNSTPQWGGGIFNTGSLTVTRSMIQENSASSGGGINNSPFGPYGWVGIIVIGSTDFLKNRAADGGGFANAGTATIVASNFYSNTATNWGGAISSESGSTLKLSDSNLFYNTTNYGGGIFNSGGMITMTHSTVYSNMAQTGGGISNLWGIYGRSGILRITNSTISNNRASYGGGIVNQNSGIHAPITITLSSSTVYGNNASVSGGGLDNQYQEGIILVQNTIVAGSATGGNCAGVIQDLGYNLDSGDSCGFNPANGSIINVDPNIGPLADNGGHTLTHALLPGSLGLNAAPQGPASDQRGVSRPQGTAYDIGAFESEGATAPTATNTLLPTTTPLSTPTPTMTTTPTALAPITTAAATNAASSTPIATNSSTGTPVPFPATVTPTKTPAAQATAATHALYLPAVNK